MTKRYIALVVLHNSAMDDCDALGLPYTAITDPEATFDLDRLPFRKLGEIVRRKVSGRSSLKQRHRRRGIGAIISIFPSSPFFGGGGGGNFHPPPGASAAVVAEQMHAADRRMRDASIEEISPRRMRA